MLTLFFANHSDEPTEEVFAKRSLGSASDGTFRQYGTFNEEGLVAKPSSLSFQQASTLTCAAVTAWNALNGH